jgi:hypothetical protein
MSSLSHQPDHLRLVFAQHQHYPLRSSWITRGLFSLVNAVRQGNSGRLFALPDACDTFGLGPEMVRSLRFWLRAVGIMDERPQGARRIPVLTPLGRILARADPYLDDLGSVWLLHAHLARNTRQAPAFSWFFQHFLPTYQVPFAREACVQALHSWAITQAPSQQTSVALLRQDIDCLVRMYLPSFLLSPEQTMLSSPFQRLALLAALPEPGSRTPQRTTLYRFVPPHPDQLSPLILLAVLLQTPLIDTKVRLRHVLREPLHLGSTLGLAPASVFEAFASLRAVAPAWCPRPILWEKEEWLVLPQVTVEAVLQQYYQP